jgi:5-methylcytosine-specific restriction endonuclease McrA
MPRAKKRHFGGLAPKYNFILNPYPDMRISSCPFCNRKTGQRKVPLLIHVDPLHLIALNYTCRYCQHCDLLIAHKHQIERLLYSLFSQLAQEAIGNGYLIIGTVEKDAWRKGLKQPQSLEETLPHAHDFKRFYKELRMTQPGWYPDDQEPPVMEPPESQDWVKK